VNARKDNRSTVPSTGQVRLHLLGNPYLQVDGESHPLSRNRASTLLAYLAARNDRDGWVTRSHLAELFGVSDIRTLLFRAEKQASYAQLGEKVIEERRGLGEMRWQIDCDVMDLRRAARESQHELVLDLYRGDFLNGLRRELEKCPDLVLIAEELRSLWTLSCATVAQALLRQGRFDQAHALWDQVMRVESDLPFEDDLLLQAMATAAETGRADMALAWFEVQRKRLKEIEETASAKVERLAQRIERGESVRDVLNVDVGLVWLPSQRERVFGRNDEFEHLIERFGDQQTRLLTITGPGGIGKTALAIWVAQSLAAVERFTQDFVFVPLEGLHDAEALVLTLANALKLNVAPADREGALFNALKFRDGLIVLDGAEAALFVRPLIERILEECPRIKVLVTSRELLTSHHPPVLVGLEEHLRLEGLSLEAALQLFDARRASQGETLTTVDAVDFAELYRRVDGLPLAITLAANLNDLTPVLNQKGGHPTQEVLRSIFNWGLEAIDLGLRQRYLHLAVLAAGFDRTSAKAVTETTLGDLNELVRKSLLTPVRGGRYAYHPLLREYAWAQVNETEGQSVKERHAVHFLGLGGSVLSALEGQPFSALIDLSNLRLAWDWALTAKRSNGLAAAARITLAIGDHATAQALTTSGLEAVSDGHERIRLLLVAGRVAALTSAERAEEVLRQAHGLAQQLEDFGLLAETELRLGIHLIHRDPQTATELLESAHGHFNQMNGAAGASETARNLARIQAEYGEHERAKIRLEASIERLRSEGLFLELAKTLTSLGVVHYIAANHPQAVAALEESIALYGQMDPAVVGFHLAANRGMLARIATASGEHRRAVMLFEEVVAVYRAHGDHRNTINALLGLNEAHLALGEQLQAVQFNIQALELALELRNLARLLDVLGHAAQLLRFSGTPDGFARALGLAQLIATHPAAERASQEPAQDLLTAFGATVSERFEWGRDVVSVGQDVLRHLRQVQQR
jgi:tetratricopeptide (TPR) repeat protein